MRQYIKFDEAVTLLKQGWEIHTERDYVSPYRPLHYYIGTDGEESKNLHHATITSLIAKGIIHGTDNRECKYKLIK